MKTNLEEEHKSDLSEQNILQSTSTTSRKTIIIFDGHGLTNKKDVSLLYKHYFLCEQGKTLGSDKFNKIIKELVKDKGIIDLSNLPNNSEFQKEHFLFEVTPHQKLYSCNLRKAFSLNTDVDYKLREIAKIIPHKEIIKHDGVIKDKVVSYNFKIQYTNFHPKTNHQLVYVRIENQESIKLSI